MAQAKSSKSSGGFVIPLCGKQTGRTLIRSRDANELIAALNSLGQISIVRSKKRADEVFYSDSNVVLSLGTVGDSESGASAAVVKRAKITAIAADSLTVSLWNNGASDYSGASVLVAKPYELRNIASETEWSIAWTYSYSASYQERTRTATGLAATKQRVFTPYRVDDVIFVANTGEATGVTSADYIDLNVDGRRWLTETEGCDPITGDPVYAFVDRGPWSDTAIGANFD